MPSPPLPTLLLLRFDGGNSGSDAKGGGIVTAAVAIHKAGRATGGDAQWSRVGTTSEFKQVSAIDTFRSFLYLSCVWVDFHACKCC